jgi:hypothetical protein
LSLLSHEDPPDSSIQLMMLRMTNAARTAARSFSLLPEFPTGAGGRQPSLWEGEITLFNVNPTVGFTLPWAGVTPAPSA